MTDLAKPLRKSVNLVGTHLEAGHDDPSHPKFPNLVTDVGSLITNARRWHDQYAAPASEREQLSYLVRNATLQAKSDADDAAIATLQAQIEAGTVTPEAAQAVLDSLTATNAKLADLDSDPLTPV